MPHTHDHADQRQPQTQAQPADRRTLFDRLRAACADDWRAYTEHPFVRDLGRGTLPFPAFQTFLVQDYLFLIQFARAHALAAYKADTLADIAAAQEGLALVVHETDLHIALTQRWGVDRAMLEATPELLGTVAYTRFVLDTGVAGDALALHVALAPCMIGYAEIGRALAPALDRPGEHPYREWIETYAAEDYQTGARDEIALIDRLAERSFTEARMSELTRVFRTATRMEAEFWQQAL